MQPFLPELGDPLSGTLSSAPVFMGAVGDEVLTTAWGGGRFGGAWRGSGSLWLVSSTELALAGLWLPLLLTAGGTGRLYSLDHYTPGSALRLAVLRAQCVKCARPPAPPGN